MTGSLDELEAVIRRELTVVARTGTTAAMNDATRALLAAFGSHATQVTARALGDIDNYRRNKPPVVHWRDDFSVPACRRDGRMIDPVLADSRRQVTCGACKRTRAWKEAA